MNSGGKIVAFSTSLLILMALLVYLSTRGPNDPILLPFLPTGDYLPTVRVGDVGSRQDSARAVHGQFALEGGLRVPEDHRCGRARGAGRR